MPEYIFVAKNTLGQEVRGEIEDQSTEAAVRRLHKRDLTVIELMEVRPRHWIWRFIQPVRQEVLVLYVRQLAVLLGAGVPIVRSLNGLTLAQRGLFRKASERVLLAVSTGFSLSQAMRRSPQFFSPYIVGAVRIGETSGRLAETLDRCASWLESEHEYNLKLKAALIYPTVLLLACGALVGFVFAFMVPRFVGLFLDFKMELPLPTRVVVEASNFVQDYWGVAVFTLVGPTIIFINLFNRWIKYPSARLKLETLSLSIPLYGRQIRYRLMSQFLRSSSTLLESGVPLGTALGLLEHAMDSQILVHTAQMQLQGVMDGLPISYGLQRSGLFPPMVLELIAVGEETGTLPQTMGSLSRFYDHEMALGLATISKLVEPTVVMILGGAVGFLLLAAFQPIYQLATSF